MIDCALYIVAQWQHLHHLKMYNADVHAVLGQSMNIIKADGDLASQFVCSDL